jgi:predicted DNA-binding protein YlxM (UPF0122 family)
MSSIEYLTSQQAEALAYLMEGLNFTEVARSLNVSKQTVVDWWTNDEMFYQSYLVAKAQILDSSLSYLLGKHKEVVDFLYGTMQDEKTGIKDRIRCAEVLLGAIAKARQDDIEMRLSRLELKNCNSLHSA